MMRKKLLSLSAVVLTIALVFIIAVCVSCCPGPNPSDDANVQGLEFILKDEGTYLVEIGNAKYLDRIEIPAYYKGVAVTEVGSFTSDSGNYNLKEIIIPDTVTRIGDSAFCGCANLTSIIIPESVTEIGDSAFTDCYKLVEVINRSELDITAGGYTHGNVAKYAKEVHSGETKIINKDGYLFYTRNGVSYLLGTMKNDSALTLPNNYGGGSYELYDYAFYNNDTIRSITIPDGVKTIGANAFKGCDRLSAVSVGKSLESIGECAFEGCKAITEIELPFVGASKYGKTNTHFGYIFGARSYDSQSSSIPASLKTVKLSGTVDVNARAFYGCTGITSVQISGEIQGIGEQAFAGCTGITSVAIGDSVKTIGKSAFLGCDKLSKVTLGKVLTTIGSNVFEGCTSIASISIPDSVVTIGAGAFKSCDKLSGVILGKSVASIGLSAFEGCTSLTSITLPFVGATLDGDTNTHFGYIFGAVAQAVEGSEDKIPAYKVQNNYIPESLVEVKVIGGSAVPAYAFYGCDGINKIEISGGVTQISSSAFENCTGLTSVSMLENVTTVGEWAFSGCSALTEIKMGKKLTDIGIRAFAGCSALESVVIPDSVTSLANGAFYECAALKSVTLSKGLTEIGGFAFWGCPIENVYVSDFAAWCGVSLENYSSNPMHSGADLYVGGTLVSVLDTAALAADVRISEIKDYAFYGCGSITGIVISDTIAKIGNSAFASCDNLTDVVFGKSLETIGASAFKNCGKIISVEIGSGLMSIEDSAFENCYRLVEVIDKSTLNIVAGSTDNGYVAFYAIEVHTEGSRIVKSGDYLFYVYNGANTLVGYLGSSTDLVLPESYSGESYAINKYAFYGDTDITSVVIPAGVSAIGRGAFQGCTSLESITIPFIGTADNDPINAHFGYIFGSAYYDTQGDYIPASLKTVKIAGGSKIAPNAFAGCSGITNVIITDSVKYIGASAFEGCTSLSEITLPFVGETVDSVENTYLGYIFGSSSYSTQQEYVPASLKTIKFTGKTGVSNYAFYNCVGIERVVLPDSVSYIGDHAFQGCIGLVSVEIGEGVKSIGIMSFFGCAALKEVVLPDSLKSIDVMAFEGCSALESIVVPAGVIGIGASAFEGCSSLTSITLPFVGQAMDSQFNSYFGYIFGASAYNSNKDYVPASLKTVVVTGGSKIDAYAFFECVGIESITLPADAIGIGYMSFFGCTSLTTVEIGSKVETIAIKAFMDCTSLNSVVIPDSVLQIGESAFEGCSGLTSITLPFIGAIKGGADNSHFGYIFGAYSYETQSDCVPASLKTVVITGGSFVDSYAFYNCIGLVDVEIARDVVRIGESAFVGCTELARVVIGDSVVVIGNGAFKSCEKLSEVVFGKALVTIGASAFEGCITLTDVILPDGMENIGESAFKSCKMISSLALGKSLLTIGESAFEGCEALVSVEIPADLKSMGASAFKGCTKLSSITLPFLGASVSRDGSNYLGYVFGAPDYFFQKEHVPASLKYVTLTGGGIVDTNDFYECTSLTYIDIRTGIHTIKESAFVGCTELTRVVIHESVITIGAGAFKSCAKLSELIIGNSVETIGASAFEGCAELVTIKIPNSVKVIGEDAFKSCTKLSEISFGNSLTTIGQSAFKDCQALKSVVVPSSVNSIGASAFEGCTVLESITLPFVGANASGTVSAYFGYIFGAPAYDSQKNYVPASLKTVKITGNAAIASYAFSECANIKSIELSAGVKTIGVMAFYKCESLESFVIPAGVTKIDSKTFNYCISLKSIVIPDNVTSIGYDAFNQCSSLDSIVIPSAVKTIGDFAFYGCTGLMSVYYTGSEEQWKSISIGSYNNAIVNAIPVYNYTPEN